MCVQELIDRLAADETISQQDYEWLMYGACLPASISMSATDPLAAEVEDLSQQVMGGIAAFSLQLLSCACWP